MFPRRYPEIILGPYLIGGVQKGFTVYEVEDPEQLANMSLRYIPEIGTGSFRYSRQR